MAKKKESHAERREREKNERLIKHTQPKIVTTDEPTEPTARKAPEGKASAKAPASKNTLKSSAKASGLKSSFLVGEEVVMTSFGKGNKAILEKKIVEGKVIPINKPESFDVEPKTYTYSIIGPAMSGSTDKPKKKEDALHAKPVLEKRYFGREFDDNIHIQLIYNILDIEKIIAAHINNIAYAIDNMLRSEAPDRQLYEYEFLGNIGSANRYEEFRDSAKREIIESRETFYKLLNKQQLRYFGSAFYLPRSSKQGKITESEMRPEEECYHIFCLLGQLMQFAKHDNSWRTWLYNLENPRTLKREFAVTLANVYDPKVTALNDGFINKSKKNLTIIFKALGLTDIGEKKKATEDYYRHIVLKDSRNIGFSVKKLRETMLDTTDAGKWRDKYYDKSRSKLYRIIDFIIFRKYDEKLAGPMIAKLRAARTDEKKDKIYADEAKRLWDESHGYFESVVTNIGDGQSVKDIIADDSIDRTWIDGVRIRTDVPLFCKLMYLVTLFLDGKEINDLLTTLINKFENIQSFIDILREEKYPLFREPDNFGNSYLMFMKSGEIAATLRAVKSFARMETPEPNAKAIMYYEAAKILGLKPGEDQKEVYKVVFGDFYAEHCKDDDDVLRPLYFEKFHNSDYDRNELFRSMRSPEENGLRNFIASNVIESSRFSYLVRYSNAESVRKLSQNKTVCKFVLSRMPETQIDRYCNSCGRDPETMSPGNRHEYLAGIISDMKFDDFIGVRQNDRKATPEQKKDKARKQATVSLYLTVLYLLTKNLIYINARYIIAIHCLERDIAIYEEKDKAEARKGNTQKKKPSKDDVNHLCLTRRFLKENYLKPPAAEYIRKNCDGYGDDNTESDDNKESDDKKEPNFNTMYIIYRNAIAHMTAVINAGRYIADIKYVGSYFELYHYLMQRHLIDAYKNIPIAPGSKLIGYMDSVRKFHTYTKDWLWGLNAPFAYNLARYKNLSVKDLFDRNEQAPINKVETAKEE